MAFVNITNRINVEMELKINDQQKDQLLANVTHDLKTPLNGIIQMIDFLHD